MSKKLSKKDIIEWALARGWVADNHGNLKKSINTKEGTTKDYRFKFGANSVRYELKSVVEATSTYPRQINWIRIKSGYFKDLSITEDGKLKGLKY